MEDDEIDILSNVNNVEEARIILQTFIHNNEKVLKFPNLSENNRRVILWTALFQHIQNKASAPVHALCFASVRILSRDKQELDNLICEKWITVLVEKAGLYSFDVNDEASAASIELPDKDIAIESMKCLCNLAFNSEVARTLCANTSIAQGLVGRLCLYKDIPFKNEIVLYDMKLLFVLTALRQDVLDKIKNELHGMDYLTSILNELLLEASRDGSASGELASGGPKYFFFYDDKQAIVCELLKTQFNLVHRPGPEGVLNEAEERMFTQLMPILPSLLSAQATSEDKLMQLRSNIANLLTGVPIAFYKYLTPKLEDGETATHVYEGRNMDAMHVLVQLLQYRLNTNTSTETQYESLSPILTVLTKGARGCREQRKYLRAVVLPPLRDVSRPPERGAALRNHLSRLLTTPVTTIRDLVADFLFVLCKENVSRLVKYTGFGNAAGHLAQRGLLRGGRGGRGAGYSSDSDDSDTDEYRRARPHLDPVVGCTRPPRPDPFEGMTDEQKEYEAMRLVNLFDRLVSEGVVRPARVGADGRPQPLQHVLQLRDQPPAPPHS